jgi:hypothetical protein
VALLLLTNMAGLRPVQVGNVVYVTTPQNADWLQARVNADSLQYLRLVAQVVPEWLADQSEPQPAAVRRAPARRRPRSDFVAPVFLPAERP